MKLLKILFLLLPVISYAGVNLKNVNYYNSYTDIVVPGEGQDLKIVRTYNSKSTDVGWFGFGWGSDFETYLVISADGSVIIHENGAGALTRFVPKSLVDAEAASKTIIGKMRERGTELDIKQEKKLVDQLKGDAELRQAYAKRFGVHAKIANNSMLYSNDHGPQKLKKVADGFIRYYNNGKWERYNSSGRLVRIQDKNNYVINLNYDKQGSLKSIKDSHAKQLFFEWYSNNRVKKIWSVDDKAAVYKFKEKDLLESKDVAGNIFKYKYDSNHNMIGVGYADGSKMEVGYEQKTQFVSSIKNRHGVKVKYEYGADSKKPDFHYWTKVAKKGFGGKDSVNKYEYFIKTKADGARYTSRIITSVNGITTDTGYNEFRLPEKIKRGGFETLFKYNSSGLLTEKKTSRGDVVKIAYDKKHNKIRQVENWKKSKKLSWTKFKYDGRGNLQMASNSGGKKVVLSYDRKGRITQMIDTTGKKGKRKLKFEYNVLGKPTTIAMEGKGTIRVDYDNYGGIKKVESKQGHKMALQVTQAFQSLLSIVKPAGVNLNM